MHAYTVCTWERATYLSELSGVLLEQRSLQWTLNLRAISLMLNLLTYWGRDKMATIFQMTFSNEFSWMKIYEFWLTHCGLGDFNEILDEYFSSQLQWLMAEISREIAVRRMSLDLTDDKSTLVQVMAWCRQATSHYLSQCWPRSLSPYDVTRPQRV